MDMCHAAADDDDTTRSDLLCYIKGGGIAEIVLKMVRAMPFSMRYSIPADWKAPHMVIAAKSGDPSGALWMAVREEIGADMVLYRVGDKADTPYSFEELEIGIRTRVKTSRDNTSPDCGVLICNKIVLCSLSSCDPTLVSNCMDAKVKVEDIIKSAMDSVHGDPFSNEVVCLSPLHVMNGVRVREVNIKGKDGVLPIAIIQLP